MQLPSLPPFFFPYFSSMYNPQARSENMVCILDSGKGKRMLIIDGDRSGVDNPEYKGLSLILLAI
jgi:hypothetical protein